MYKTGHGKVRSMCVQAPLVIHNPHALPMYREDRPHGKRKREKDRMDPVKSQAPERGSAAQLKPGTGGTIGSTGGTLLTQYILKNQVRSASMLDTTAPRQTSQDASCCLSCLGRLLAGLQAGVPI